MSTLHNLSKRLQRSWRRAKQFRAGQCGVASIEFAMIVPLMVMMFVGTVELSQAITVDRRVNQVASSVADLVARTKSTTGTDLDDTMNVIDELFKPYDHTPVRLTLTNVIASTSDETNTVVCWSHNYTLGGVGSYAQGSAYALPTGIVEKGESVIVAEIKYTYTPLIFSYFITGAVDFTDTFYLKPRLSSSIEMDGNKCTAPA